jgi:hypothetical protein
LVQLGVSNGKQHDNLWYRVRNSLCC